MDCNSCGVRFRCPLAAEPGSLACTFTLFMYGGEKRPYQTPGTPKFCPICGKPLKVIGTERFCNNVQCENRYIPMEGHDRSWMK